MTLPPRIMPSFDSVIEHGTFPDIDLPVNEPNLLVNSVSFKAAREKKEFKGADSKAVERVRLTNPILTISIDAFISTQAGLAAMHPGKEVTAGLENFSSAWREFDPTDGVLVFGDPEDEANLDDMVKTKFDVMHYPYVA